MSDLQLMVVLVPGRLHEDLVDVLMTLDGLSGFSAVEAAGFSREHSHFDVAEQVAGARRFSRFEILHSPAQREGILEAIEPLVGREHVRYWVVELVATGRLPGAINDSADSRPMAPMTHSREADAEAKDR